MAREPATVSRTEPELRPIESSLHRASVPAEWAQDFELEGEGESPSTRCSSTVRARQEILTWGWTVPRRRRRSGGRRGRSAKDDEQSSDYRGISFRPIVLGGRRMVRWNYEVEGDRRVVSESPKRWRHCDGGVSEPPAISVNSRSYSRKSAPRFAFSARTEDACNLRSGQSNISASATPRAPARTGCERPAVVAPIALANCRVAGSTK